MKYFLHAAIFWLLGVAGAQAQYCAPQQVYQLQMQGYTPQAIAQMCSGGMPNPVQPMIGNMCMTQFGACAVSGYVGSGCSCFTPYGPVSGVIR